MADELTEEQITAFREAYALFDKEGQEILPISDLESVMKALGQSPTDVEITHMSHIADPDGKGVFSFEAFLNLMGRILKGTDKTLELREAFRVFDREGNGLVSAAELRHALTNHGERLSEEEVDEMMREAYIDDDGFIKYEDFVTILAAAIIW